MTHTICVENVPLQFIDPLENVRPKVVRDVVKMQNILPAVPFKPWLLMDTPLQFTKNTSRQAENFKRAVRQFTDFVRELFSNN